MGYSLQGHKESDTTERLHSYTHTYILPQKSWYGDLPTEETPSEFMDWFKVPPPLE